MIKHPTNCRARMKNQVPRLSAEGSFLLLITSDLKAFEIHMFPCSKTPNDRVWKTEM